MKLRLFPCFDAYSAAVPQAFYAFVGKKKSLCCNKKPSLMQQLYPIARYSRGVTGGHTVDRWRGT